MLMEIFVHVSHLTELNKGKSVNCKINYASQYDVRLFINPKKYNIYVNSQSTNLIVIKKKNILDYLGLRKLFKK